MVTEKLVKGKDLGEGKKEEDRWVRVWDSYDKLTDADEELINMATFNSSLIVGVV